jgi:calcium-dependent protein kinase
MGNCTSSSQNELNKNKDASKAEMRTNMVYATQNRSVYGFYDQVRVIGEGSMGSISLIRKKQEVVGGSAYKNKKFGKGEKAPDEVVRDGTGKVFALKSILLTKVSDDMMEELRNEIGILQTLDHPNIVKELEIYETKLNIYLVLEHCSGGDLYTRGPYSEKAACEITDDLLSAVSHMHKHGITHRDLKFENIMFESREDDAKVKIIDYGLAHKALGSEENMTEGVGTMYTLAPEVLMGNYTSKVDIWSLGVVSFMLLSGTKPFNERRRSRMIAKIKQAEYTFQPQVWDNLSESSKDFVSSLIVADPAGRPTADDALKNPWLNEQGISDETVDPNTLQGVQDCITEYGEMSEFKKLALMVIAHKTTTQDIVELRKVFETYDTSKDGIISLDEFKAAMNSTGEYTDEEITQMFQTIDQDLSGTIYYTEFLAATLEARGRIVEEKLADAFDRMDVDDTGYISRKNLKDFLGEESSETKINQLISEVDLDGDGKISFKEFKGHFAEQRKERNAVLIKE